MPWIRFLYAYPATLDEGLLDLMASAPRFVPYLDIPLQHSSRRVLKAMKRGGDGRSYLGLIHRARATVPSIALRSTLIVGFPGEGEQEFEELLEFVLQARFDHLGVFGYSWQEENRAELGDPVPAELKAERRDRILAAQQSISLEHNRALVGRTVPAIVAGPLREMELLTEGRLQRQAPEIDGRLLINDGSAAAGSLVEVEVTVALGDPINTTARLESVNKQLGILVCVSEATLSGQPDFPVRPVGRLVLKGKTQALMVYQPVIPAEGSAAVRTRPDEAAYALMRDEQPAALEAFERLAAERPDDPLVRLHLKRLKAGAHGDRIVMESK